VLSLRFQALSRAESTVTSFGIIEADLLTSLDHNLIPDGLRADIDALLADPSRAALASGEADTKPAMHD
jgi:hypothetical protein